MPEVVVKPVGAGKFSAEVNRLIVVQSSRTPFFDAARALLAGGNAADEGLWMRHEGSETISLRSTIGRAARMTVSEGDDGLRLRKWQPYGV